MINCLRSTVFILIMIAATGIIAQTSRSSVEGGEYYIENSECLLDVDRQKVKRQLQENIYALKVAGKINESVNKSIVSFKWPLAKADNFTFNSYYGISNYVDHNPVAIGSQYGPSNLDYFCGNKTYDTESGYNHAGVDIFLWPFEWYMVDNDFVEVVAAAPGVIIDKQDGFEDDHCSCEGQWNAIYVRHDDGSVAWYGHMKRNSLTSKEFGDTVAAGEYLGVVASSGCSTGPHLHFEVYDADNNLVDPFAGDCNVLNSGTWWEEQRPYSMPTLNAILTHEAIPVFGCPSSFENPKLRDYFDPLDRVFTAFYYADQEAGQITEHRILTPSGLVYEEWTHVSPDSYNASYWFWNRILPADAENGMWTVEADFAGETITHNFFVGVSATHNLGTSEINIFPNPTSDIVYIKSDNQRLMLNLFDASGKRLMVSTERSIDLAAFANGVYLLMVEDTDGNKTVERITKI